MIMMWNGIVVALLAGAAVAQIAPAVAPSVSPIPPAPVDPMMAGMANLTGMEPGMIPVEPMPLGSAMPSAAASPPAGLGSLPVVANMPAEIAPVASPMVAPMEVMPSPMMAYPSPMMTYPTPGPAEPAMWPTMEPSPMMMGLPVTAAVSPASVPLTIPVAPARVICPNTCRLSFKGVVGTPSYVLSGAPDAAFTPGITGTNFATALEVGEASVNGVPISQTGLTPNMLGLYAIGFAGSYGIGYRTMTPAQKTSLNDACVVVPITHYIDGAGTEVVVSTNPAADCVAFRIVPAVVRTPAPVAPVLPVAV